MVQNSHILFTTFPLLLISYIAVVLLPKRRNQHQYINIYSTPHFTWISHFSTNALLLIQGLYCMWLSHVPIILWSTSFSVSPRFGWPWHCWRVRYLVEWPPVWVCLMFGLNVGFLKMIPQKWSAFLITSYQGVHDIHTTNDFIIKAEQLFNLCFYFFNGCVMVCGRWLVFFKLEKHGFRINA